MNKPSESIFGDDKLGLNVAEFLANFNMLELTLYQALADMLDDKECVITEAILSRVDSVAYKMNVIFDVAAVKLEAKDVAKIIKQHEPDIRRLTGFRNKLAHGLYGQKEGGERVVIANVFRVGRSAVTSEPLKRKEVYAGAVQIHEIMKAITASCANEGISLHGGNVTAKSRIEHG